MNSHGQKKLPKREFDAKKSLVAEKYHELQANLLQSANKDYHNMKNEVSMGGRGKAWSERDFNEKLQ